MIVSLHNFRRWSFLFSALLFVVEFGLAAVPDLVPGQNTIVSVEDFNQELPRTSAFQDKQALSCYNARWSIEINQDILCTLVISNGTHLTASMMQSAASDGARPEVKLIASGLALLCFHGVSNEQFYCKALSYESGILAPKALGLKLTSAQTGDKSVPTVRPAIVNIGNNQAVVCFQGKFDSGDPHATNCIIVNVQGSTLNKGSEVILKQGATNIDVKELSLASIGTSARRLSAAPSKAILCYVVPTTNELNCCVIFDGSTMQCNAIQVEANNAQQISLADSQTDTTVLCYEFLGGSATVRCRGLQISGTGVLSLTLSGSVEVGQLATNVDYPIAVVEVSENVFIVCYVDTNNRGLCKAISNVGGVHQLADSDLSQASPLALGGASELSLASIASDLAVMCWRETIPDNPIKCTSVVYPASCAAPANIDNAQTPCSVSGTILHGGACTCQCSPGYDPSHPSLECSHGLFYPSTFTCIEKSCNTLTPANGGLGNCGATLVSGGSCQPTCESGYSPSGQMSCDKGALTDVTCVPDSCGNLEAPGNGGLGDCGPSLASGESCMPECNSGYKLSGNIICELGLVTKAECFLVPEEPEGPGPAPVIVSSSVSGGLLLCCCCICGIVCKKDKNRHGRKMIKLGMSGNFHDAWGEWTGLLQDFSGFKGSVYFDLDGDLQPKTYGLSGRISVSGPDLTVKPSKSEVKELNLTHLRFEKFRKEHLASRCIVLVSHEKSQRDKVKDLVNSISENYMLDCDSGNIIYFDSDTQSQEPEFKKTRRDAGIPDEWRLATKGEVEKNMVKVKAIMEQWDICMLAGSFKISGSGYGNKVDKHSDGKALGHQIITKEQSYWRWHWLVGVVISRTIICVVSKAYLQSPRCCNEYISARKTKKAVTLLMFDREEVTHLKTDSEEIREHIKIDGGLVEYSSNHDDDAFGAVMGDLLSGRHSLALRIQRVRHKGKAKKQLLRMSRAIGAFSLTDKGMRNDEDARVGHGTTEGAEETFYCGRFLGVKAIPGSDGHCGPNNGPQCASCKRLQAAVNQNDEKDENGAPWWKKYVVAAKDVGKEALQANNFREVAHVGKDAFNVGEGALSEAWDRYGERASIFGFGASPKAQLKKKIKRKVPKRNSGDAGGDGDGGFEDTAKEENSSSNLLISD